jgi:hypothetical protein
MMLHGSPKHIDDLNHSASFASTSLTVTLFQPLIIALSIQTAFTSIRLEKPLVSLTLSKSSITS